MIDNLTEFVQPINEHIFRIVESQEKSATMRLIDSFEEQELLEQLLEASKPADFDNSRHYLISTPFRYPPLEHGSRFGNVNEPSLFYGSHNIHTMLHEAAYYTFYFAEAMSSPFNDIIVNHKTSFRVNVNTPSYMDLSRLQEKLMDKQDYLFAQSVGQAMREMEVQAFSYTSARDESGGKNMGVFEIDAIQGNPSQIDQWQIKQTATDIMFRCTNDKSLNQEFNIESFMVNNQLPAPSF